MFRVSLLDRIASPVALLVGWYQRYRSSVVLTRFVRIFRVDVLVRASNILLLPVYLRLMTPEEFGLYGYIATIIGTAGLFLNLGLFVPQVKLFSDYGGEQKGVLCFTLNVTLLGFLLILFGIFAFTNADATLFSILIGRDFDYGSIRGFVLLTLAANVFGLMLYSYFMAAEEIGIIQKQNIVRLVAVHAGVMLLLYFTIENRALARVKFVCLAELLVVTLFFRQLFQRMVFRYDWAMARRSLLLGLPIMGGGLLNMIYALSDRYFLSYYTDLKTLAIYNLGASICSVIPFITASVQSVYAPLFFKEKRLDVGFARFKRVLRYAFWGYVVSGVGLMLATEILLRTSIIKEDYATVIFVLPFMLTATIITSLGQFFLNYTTYFEVGYVALLVAGLSSGINVVLNSILVPGLSIYGAALSNLGAALVALACLQIFVKRRLGKSVLPAAALPAETN
jgi:O-antigen/teichoic acid export membrane protein